MASRIRWSGVKKVRRALEKVLRSYREVVPPAQLAQNCTPAAQTLASSAFSVMAMPFLFPMPFLCRPAEASNRRPRGPGPQDVSRLVDLCREGIVFDRLSDLAACLEARVVRVKNRLDPAHRSGASAGYRDVALNLRLAGPAARRLGLDMHVCELQLLLRSFAQLKVRDGRAPRALAPPPRLRGPRLCEKRAHIAAPWGRADSEPGRAHRGTGGSGRCVD